MCVVGGVWCGCSLVCVLCVVLCVVCVVCCVCCVLCGVWCVVCGVVGVVGGVRGVVVHEGVNVFPVLLQGEVPLLLFHGCDSFEECERVVGSYL